MSAWILSTQPGLPPALSVSAVGSGGTQAKGQQRPQSNTAEPPAPSAPGPGPGPRGLVRGAGRPHANAPTPPAVVGSRGSPSPRLKRTVSKDVDPDDELYAAVHVLSRFPRDASQVQVPSRTPNPVHPPLHLGGADLTSAPAGRKRRSVASVGGCHLQNRM